MSPTPHAASSSTAASDVRPLFAYWGWRSVCDDVDDALVEAAASLELLHCCALVHDDLMDRSDTRRVNPSAHSAFAALHRHPRPGRVTLTSSARPSAVLLGDLLLYWADAVFARRRLRRPGALRLRRDAAARDGRPVSRRPGAGTR